MADCMISNLEREGEGRIGAENNKEGGASFHVVLPAPTGNGQPS